MNARPDARRPTGKVWIQVVSVSASHGQGSKRSGYRVALPGGLPKPPPGSPLEVHARPPGIRPTTTGLFWRVKETLHFLAGLDLQSRLLERSRCRCPAPKVDQSGLFRPISIYLGTTWDIMGPLCGWDTQLLQQKGDAAGDAVRPTGPGAPQGHGRLRCGSLGGSLVGALPRNPHKLLGPGLLDPLKP